MLSPAQNVWSSAESWDQLTWNWDWDFFISSARALRIYLYEHGTIPLWNLYICGGQLELPNPQSFALTWPSLFIYLFPPALAFMMLWLVMSAVGAWSNAGLLRLYGVGPGIAWIFSVAFTSSGFFAAHFNQGHATFAFFHLISLVAFTAAREMHGQRSYPARHFSLVWGVVLSSFLLFSAPSIQALVYGLPALLVLWLVHGAPVRILASSLCGLMLAAYKFVPVIFQSLSRHRDDIFREQYSPAIFMKTLFTFVSRPGEMWAGYKFPWRFYGWWEYAAFVSPAFVLAALAGALLLIRKRDRLLVSGILLMVIGFILTLGNGFWLERFGGIPVLRSIRVFPRFQFLFLLGAAWVGALFVQALWNRAYRKEIFLRGSRRQALILLIVALFVALPSFVQSAVMIYRITAFPDRQIVEHFNLDAGMKSMTAGEGLWLSRRMLEVKSGILSAQDLIVRTRAGIAEECYDPFFPVKQQFQPREPAVLRPMASPLNVHLAMLDAGSFEASVPETLKDNLILNLALMPETTIGPMPVLSSFGLTFAPEQVTGKKIRFSVDMQDMMFGVYLSLFTAFCCAVLFLRERLRR